ERIREIVGDPKTAELLSPDNVIGCKRPCLDTNYFETYNRDNVTLVNVRDNPVERITPKGVVTDGQEYELDSLIFATGFDAMTGALLNIDVRGRGGQTLDDKWSAGPRTYLGLSTVGFPNMFMISGPGSPSVLTNMITSIEQHVVWIHDCLEYLREKRLATIEATPPAEDDWVDHVNAVADLTLYPTCNSWYLGKNIPGKPQVFMPLIGFPPYVEKCDAVAAGGYEGFELDSAP
ncbi:MAG: cyclohexanone monooxygenase, partial [Gammaproteobacteria bacterium]|nr:cyclohexanone monooxygenase [Gammaproteobacteria bacterium]